MKDQPCSECESIFWDFLAALTALSRDVAIADLDPDFKDALRAAAMRTEEDAALSESFSEERPLKNAADVRRTIERKQSHEVRTGHKAFARGLRGG